MPMLGDAVSAFGRLYRNTRRRSARDAAEPASTPKLPRRRPSDSDAETSDSSPPGRASYSSNSSTRSSLSKTQGWFSPLGTTPTMSKKDIRRKQSRSNSRSSNRNSGRVSKVVDLPFLNDTQEAKKSDEVRIDSELYIPKDLFKSLMKMAEESIDHGVHRSVRVPVSPDPLAGTKEILVLNVAESEGNVRSMKPPIVQVPFASACQGLSKSVAHCSPTSSHLGSTAYTSDHTSPSTSRTVDFSWAVDLEREPNTCMCGSVKGACICGHATKLSQCEGCGFLDRDCLCAGDVSELSLHAQHVPDLTVHLGRMMDMRPGYQSMKYTKA